MNGAEFARQCRAHQVPLEQGLLQVAQATSFAVFEQVVIGGPYGNPTGTVRTGTARGAWYPALNTLPDREGIIGTAPDPSGQSVMALVAEIVSRMRLGDTIIFVNGTDYAIMLEYGWSKQAPQGMVRLTMASGQRILNDVVQQFVRPL
jgi:hypothetical protein